MAEDYGAELARRYRKAVLTGSAMFALTALLVALAFGGVRPTPPDSLNSPVLRGALWFAIPFLGLGAIAIRRTRFAAPRLEAVAALRGVRGLLATLERTTTLVAALGGAIAVIGYALTLLTNDTTYMRNAAIVSIAVLFYGYPRRRAWQRVVEAVQQPDGLTGPAAAKGTTA
ncbi:MAG TPA: hypothetical protein VF546_08535 [Pyrinomonadaceae bacterium]